MTTTLIRVPAECDEPSLELVNFHCWKYPKNQQFADQEYTLDEIELWGTSGQIDGTKHRESPVDFMREFIEENLMNYSLNIRDGAAIIRALETPENLAKKFGEGTAILFPISTYLGVNGTEYMPCLCNYLGDLKIVGHCLGTLSITKAQRAAVLVRRNRSR